MLSEQIFDAAAAFSGAGSEELRALCGAAETELCARLRDGVSAESCGEVFVTAAAFLALAMLAEVRSAGGTESWSAGSVSQKSSPAGSERALRQRAETLMAPFVRDGGFYFAGVCS